MCVSIGCNRYIMTGFGDIQPSTTGGKIFNVFFIATGLAVVGYAMGTLGESVVKGVRIIAFLAVLVNSAIV